MTASDTSILTFDSSDEYRPEPAPEPQPPAWRDGSVRIGIHTSIAGGFAGALESASKLGCNALQIFSASPRMWPRVGSRIPETAAAEFRAKRAALGLGPLVIHANYLINLASSDPVMRVRSIQAFHDEIVRGVALGADYLVVHPGSSLGNTPAQSIRDVSQALRQAARGVRLCAAFGDLRDCRLRLLLENTSGMGAAIGSRFEELKAILDGAPELPLGVCLDTAHAFHAGYDIRSEAGLAQTIAALERTVGLSRVAVLHVNDSKTPFASRVDRHEHIGRGHIGRGKAGLEAFRRILNHPSLSASAGRTGSGGNKAQEVANENGKSNCGSGGWPGRAFLLETPIDAPGDDRRNVRRLWDLVGIAAKQAPRAQNGFSMLRAKRRSRAHNAAAKVTSSRRTSPGKGSFGAPAKSSFRRKKKSRAPKG
jgi:deoxyribonuclease IV